MGLFELPVLERLESARNILISGAGGGFDVFAGLPLALALRSRGKPSRSRQSSKGSATK